MYLRREVVHEVPGRQQVLGAQAPPADAAAVARLAAADILIKKRAGHKTRDHAVAARMTSPPRPRHHNRDKNKIILRTRGYVAGTRSICCTHVVRVHMVVVTVSSAQEEKETA